MGWAYSPRRQRTSCRPSDVFVPMVLPMLFAIGWLYFLGTMYGRMERKRLGIVQLDISHGENIQISDNPEANRADLRWFNALLTVVLMICLVFSHFTYAYFIHGGFVYCASRQLQKCRLAEKVNRTSCR